MYTSRNKTVMCRHDVIQTEKSQIRLNKVCEMNRKEFITSEQEMLLCLGAWRFHSERKQIIIISYEVCATNRTRIEEASKFKLNYCVCVSESVIIIKSIRPLWTIYDTHDSMMMDGFIDWKITSSNALVMVVVEEMSELHTVCTIGLCCHQIVIL